MTSVALFLAVVTTFASRRVAGSWTHPSSVTGGAWCLFLVAPVLGGFRDAPLTGLAIVAIVGGAFVAAHIHVRPAEVIPWRITARPLLRWYVLFSGIAGAVAALWVLRANGLASSGLFSLSALNVAARRATVLRYSGGLTIPAFATLLLGCTYAGAMAAPFAAVGQTRFRKALLLATPAGGASLYTVATTARAGFLIAAVITIGAWTITTSLTHGGRAKLKGRSIFGLCLGGAAVAFVFIYAAATRLGGWTSGMWTQLLRSVAVYAGGGVPAFEGWISSGDGRGSLGFGSQTLAGVSQFWVSNPHIGQAYADRIGIGMGSTTNVYTILRPLTEDFTLPGAVAILICLSVASASAFRYAALNGSIVAATFVAAWLAVVLFSSTTSILTFVNVCFGLSLGIVMVGCTTKAAVGTPSFSDVSHVPMRAGSRPSPDANARSTANCGSAI